MPPHNLDAEASLLGAMLLSKDAISAATETGLSADEFYKPAHGHIYDAVTTLYAAGEHVDPVTVADVLRRAGLIDAIGGPAVLVSLQASTPATSNAARYARIVSEHALLRRMIGVAGEIAELGYSVPDDVIAAVDRAESLMFEVAERRVADTLSPIKDLLERSLERLEMLYEKGDSITGLATGYNDLDELLSGLQPSTLNIVGARPATGKALALDTPVPTPEGWTTMGELAAGDRVLDELGRPCTVLYTSPVFPDHRCYDVRFDDGTSIVADGGHRWLAYDRLAWQGHADRATADRVAAGRVLTTEELLAEGVHQPDGRPTWYVPLAGALDLPDADLQVEPYVLGLWLAGGFIVRSTFSGGSVGHTSIDAPKHREHVLDALADAGYATDGRGVEAALQATGLLDGCRRHIPAVYLRASAKQRLALLQGVMDAAGDVDRAGRTVELHLTNTSLLQQVREVALSLGHKAEPVRGNRLGWTPLDPVFRLPRKAAAQADVVSRCRTNRATRRAIVDIVAVQTVPTRCISVDSPSHLFLAGREMVPTHNTAFALGMATHAALEANRPVLLFSLEMSHLELTQRILSAEARVDSTRMRNGKLADADWQKLSHAIGRLAEAPLFIDDNPRATVMEIRAKARRLKARHGDLGLIVIDYLQLMTGRTSAENRQVEVSEISRGLKVLARELETPVVALSQLSRNLELRSDKRPMLADLRESGSLEQDADVVMFLYRDELYNAESQDRGTCEVIVSKHRAGPTGMMRLAFLDHYTRFANMARGV